MLMGNRVVCCRSQSNGGNGTTAEPPAPAPQAAPTPAAEITEPPAPANAEAPAPAPDSEEAGRRRAASAAHYFNSIGEKILAAGQRVPLVGEFCGLLLDTWQHIEDLKGTVDDANDVMSILKVVLKIFDVFLDLSGNVFK